MSSITGKRRSELLARFNRQRREMQSVFGVAPDGPDKHERFRDVMARFNAHRAESLAVWRCELPAPLPPLTLDELMRRRGGK